jgi:hypothetical protein
VRLDPRQHRPQHAENFDDRRVNSQHGTLLPPSPARFAVKAPPHGRERKGGSTLQAGEAPGLRRPFSPCHDGNAEHELVR